LSSLWKFIFFISQIELDQPSEIDDTELKPAGVEPSSAMAGMED